MKLVVILIGLLLAIDAASLVPMSEYDTPVGEEMPESTREDTDEGGLQEVHEYSQEMSLEARQASNEGAIGHGDTVALQTWARLHWLGCAGAQCGKADCPKMYMTGNDWNNCWGEVFRIYRASGPGAVRVGDLVGLYYPREEGKWLGCAGGICGKAPCPGVPTTSYGFARKELWKGCWGEVFQIYTPGKGNNEIINSDDDIALYFVQGKTWVSQAYEGSTTKRTCLGTSRPPATPTYDGCAYETFRIWKKLGC